MRLQFFRARHRTHAAPDAPSKSRAFWLIFRFD
jgi:hypothetical protein